VKGAEGGKRKGQGQSTLRLEDWETGSTWGIVQGGGRKRMNPQRRDALEGGGHSRQTSLSERPGGAFQVVLSCRTAGDKTSLHRHDQKGGVK